MIRGQGARVGGSLGKDRGEQAFPFRELEKVGEPVLAQVLLIARPSFLNRPNGEVQF